MRRQIPVGRRIPGLRVDAVQDSDIAIAFRGEHPVEPCTKGRRQRFFGIGRTDGRREVAETDSGLQEAELAPELSAFDGKHAPVKTERWHRLPRKETLIRQVM